MNREQIKQLQRRIRLSYDVKDREDCDDGFWGPKSNTACQKHLRAMMPNPNPWPAGTQAALRAFYGAPGDTSQHTRILVPSGVTVRYFDKELGKPGPQDDYIAIHKKLATSLERILINVAQVPGGPHVLRFYAGVYNNRSVTNGSTPSLHAYAAAIDLDPANNRNGQHWPTSATMPLEVMECFAREGWLPAGAFWNRDAMHFQATR